MPDNRRRREIGGYDADAKAFFAVVTSLTLSQKNAVNNFIKGLKADNIWKNFDRLYINVGTTIADYAVCLKTLTSRANVNSVTWSSTGSVYNGTTNYFRCDIQVNQATQLTLNDGSAGFIWDPANPPFTNQTILIGCTEINNWMAIQFNSSA